MRSLLCPASLLLLCATALLPSCSTPAVSRLPDIMAPQATRLAQVPARAPLIRCSMGLPLVRAKINGKHDAVFLFDTGASTAILSPRLIKKAKLVELPVSFDHFGAKQGFYEVETLDLGEINLEQFLATNDARGILDDFSSSIGTRVDGVLSLSNFNDLLVTADFRRYELRFEPGQLARGARGTERSRSDAGRPVIKIEFADASSHLNRPFIIDTGGAGGLQFSIKQGTLPFAAVPLGTTDYRTYYGDNRYRTLRLDGTARIGAAILRSPQVELHDSGTDVLGEHFGTAGMRALHGLVLTFDSERNLVRIADGKS